MTASSEKVKVTPAQLLASPEFKALVRARRKLWIPTVVIIIAAYFGFILCIAFDPALLGHTIGNGNVSIGIYIGLGLLLLSFILTAIYLKVSSGTITDLQEKIRTKYSVT